MHDLLYQEFHVLDMLEKLLWNGLLFAYSESSSLFQNKELYSIFNLNLHLNSNRIIINILNFI